MSRKLALAVVDASISKDIKQNRTFIANSIVIRTVAYKCTNCESVDRVSIFEHEAFPQTINCWNCHAGYNMPVEQMMMQGKGMFPTEALDVHGNKKDRVN